MKKHPNVRNMNRDRNLVSGSEASPDYNDGRLVGRWMAADREADEVLTEVEGMLRTDAEPGAEEWAIFDYEGFGPLRLGEHESIELVTRIARGIGEYGPALAHLASLVMPTEPGDLDRFEDVYVGHYESIEDYATQLLDDLGYLKAFDDSVPPFLEPYARLDLEAFASDMEASGQFLTSRGDGGVYIFDMER
jgi:antirestriction protein